MFIVHGFAEHSEWYDHVAEPLADRGMLVASHDHGMSCQLIFRFCYFTLI